MGRSTIERQINKALFDKQGFGESRHEAKQELRNQLGEEYRFGMTDEKIHSYVTFDTYQKACQKFGKWLVEEKGINKYAKIQECKEYAKEYIEYRLNTDKVSVWTAKTERSALGKMYGERIEVEMPKREVKEIKRSRMESKGDKLFNEERHKDLADIAKATGCRRCDMVKIRPHDFRTDDRGNLWLDIKKSKGGRDRTVPVLPQYKDRIQEIIKDAVPDKKIFGYLNKHADIHAYRGEYARALHEAVNTDRTFRADILKEYPERHEYKTYKDKDGNRVTYEIKSETITTRQGKESQTFNRDDVYCVSQALGHNRLDVTIAHYLK